MKEVDSSIVVYAILAPLIRHTSNELPVNAAYFGVRKESAGGHITRYDMVRLGREPGRYLESQIFSALGIDRY